jgi:HSP20 family protein
MALARWDPFRDMVSLRDAMDRLFEESFVRPLPAWSRKAERALGLSADMYETDDNLIINADLPGVKPEDVDISIRDNVLTIQGEYKSEEENEDGNVHFRERQYGRFQRSIALPSNINTEATEATFEEGVLKMTLPKAEEAKPKQIPVKTKS